MRKQHDDDDQWNRNTEKPEQDAATHFNLPSARLTLNCFFVGRYECVRLFRNLRNGRWFLNRDGFGFL
jgi:hypothetical protein